MREGMTQPLKKKRGRPRGSPTVNRTPTEGRVSTAQAAMELQMSPPTLRWLMEHGRLDIGDYIRKEGNVKAQIIIYRALLDKEKEARGL